MFINRLFIFIVLLLLSSYVVYAQNNKIDSLKKVLHFSEKPPKQDSLWVNALNEYASACHVSVVDSTIFYAHKALAIAQKINYELGEVEALRNLGTGYGVQGDVVMAVKYLDKALIIAKRRNELTVLSKLYNNYGNLYLPKDAELALDYYQKSLTIRRKLGNPKLLATILLNMGSIYIRLKKYDEAVQYYQESLVLKEKLNDKRGVALIYGNIGVVYKEKGHYEEAKKYTSKAIVLHQSLTDQTGVFHAYTLMGDVLSLEKKYQQAISYQLKGLEISQKIHAKQQIASIANRLQMLYAQTEDYKNAYQYSTLYKLYSDSLLNESNIKQNTQLEDKILYEKKELLLKAEQEKELVTQRFYMYATLVVIALLAIILLMFMRNRYIQKKNNTLLAKQNVAIQKQSAELQQLNETKDKIFAIIGHDLRSPINSLRSILALLNNQHITKEEFALFSVKLQRSVENIHFTLTNLLQWAKRQMENITPQPTEINLFELAQENINLLHETAQNKNLVLLNQLDTKIVAFADKDQISLVLRNLISNAIKFTPENNIITIGGELTLTNCLVFVKDTGIGMRGELLENLFTSHSTTYGTKGEKGTGLGMVLCKDFIDKNGGNIWAESTLGKGTTIYFTLLSIY
jgi:signal transduction histidine kinase